MLAVWLAPSAESVAVRCSWFGWLVMRGAAGRPVGRPADGRGGWTAGRPWPGACVGARWAPRSSGPRTRAAGSSWDLASSRLGCWPATDGAWPRLSPFLAASWTAECRSVRMSCVRSSACESCMGGGGHLRLRTLCDGCGALPAPPLCLVREIVWSVRCVRTVGGVGSVWSVCSA